MDFHQIQQLPVTIKTCKWHQEKDGQVFDAHNTLPGGACPWLYHSLYPYFLGMLYGARYDYNEMGDCQVCCPAANGVNTIVRKRDNDGSFDSRISSEMRYVIFAEVVGVKGDCPAGHKVGDRIIFPTCMPEYFMCPAGFNNVFPFLKLKLPSCINKKRLRCPDWEVEISYSL